ncbi:MAG TPA: SRPBCC family protein [Candidatus Saccharimonadia bacterium]|nr:SRPBCC family protein [Candidatus Saccharimonadia bacterium]
MSPTPRAPLHFEHLVQINDARDPRVTPLTRDQLWRGLVLRAEFPKTFVPWLDACEIEHAGADLLRTLRFGAQVVHDRVSFDAMQQVSFETLDQGDDRAFRMNMRIEEPAPGALFVRFTYDARSPEHSADDPHSGAIKEAYRLADIDTVFRIRQLADSGVLDEG